MLRFMGVFAVALGICVSANAQEPRPSLIGHQPAFYSPDDFFTGKLGYRIQTGQAGLYRMCDDDSAKRYSPYIEWQERDRCRQGVVGYELLSCVKDAQRKVVRWNWGKAGCGHKPGSCQCGNQALKPPAVLGLIPSGRVSNEPAH